MTKAILGTKSSFPCVYKVCLRVSEQILTYKISFNYSGPIVHIQVKDFLLNGELPDALADQLAHQCGEALYPLEVSLSEKGSLYKIHNYTTLKNRWNSSKNTLFRYYSDSYSQAYLQKTDSNYNTEEKLFHQLINNPLFFLYFIELDRPGAQENNSKEYIQKYKGVDFDFIQWVENNKEESEFYHLYKEGDHPDRKEKMELSYKISSTYNIIEKACFTFFKNEKVIQQLTLERDPDSPEVTLVKKEIMKKRSLGFWIDEKQETSLTKK